MTITRRSSLAEVAAIVAAALGRAGIEAVLTGGACVSIYLGGAYLSHDLDFVVRGSGTRRALDAAMEAVGFARDGDRYLHASSPFFVEFPGGPLSIGDDAEIVPVVLRFRGGSILALSATDACRDRLAAFYHWSDRQSLEVAVAIARRRRVNLRKIRTWSLREGAEDRFLEFRTALRSRRRARR